MLFVLATRVIFIAPLDLRARVSAYRHSVSLYHLVLNVFVPFASKLVPLHSTRKASEPGSRRWVRDLYR